MHPLPTRFLIGRTPFLAVKLPIPPQPTPDSPAQPPYVPDFWNSARPNIAARSEPALPKLHIVSGAATHYDGGPTHNLEKLEETHTSSASTGVGFSADFWESIGLPRSFNARRALSEAAAQAKKDESKTRSRPLTDQERRGLYILLGIVGGSWLAGGLVGRA